MSKQEPTEVPVLDPTAIARLRELETMSGEPGFAREVTDDYLRGVDQQLNLVQHALDMDDIETASRAAHTLKGRSGMLGARRLQELARQAQEKADAGLASDTRALLPALEQARGEIALALEQYWAENT